MGERITKGPEAAEKTIDVVLDEFLQEQHPRLKPRTVRKYENVISLFQSCLNNYGYEGLNKQESVLFERSYAAKGNEHREFCQLFGPEKIPANVGEFLGYYMVRKVMCGKELMQAAGTVTRKLGNWLCEKGYILAEDADGIVSRGATAARELPAAQELTRMLSDYADRTAVDCDDVIEDHFCVDAVEPGKLHLSSLIEGEALTVPVSREISSACRVGWRVSGAVGRTGKGFRILEVWHVYP